MGQIEASLATADCTGPFGRRVAGNVLAMLAVGAASIVLGLQERNSAPAALPEGVRSFLQSIMEGSAQFAADMMGHPLQSVPHGLMTERDSSPTIVITKESLARVIGLTPALTVVVLAATVAAWRAWGFRCTAGVVLVVLGMILPAMLLPVLSGTFQGLVLGLELPRDAFEVTWSAAKGAATVLVCAAMAIIWCLCSWVTAEEQGEARADTEGLSLVRPTSLWTAAAAVWMECLFWLLAAITSFLGYGRQWGIEAVESDWWSVRYGLGAACSAVAGVLIVWSLIRRSGAARWAWVPLMGLIPLGGEAGGAMAVLFASVAAGDEHVMARSGKAMSEAAWGRIRRRVERPLPWWLWAIALIGVMSVAALR